MANRFQKYAQPDSAIEGNRFAKYLPPIEEGNDAGALRAFAYGVTSGQIPFGNRITSVIGATGAKASDLFRDENLFDNQSFGDLYTQSLADTKATQEAHPYATLGGNIAGIATTLPFAVRGAITGTVPTAGIRGFVNTIPQALATVRNFAGSGKAAQDAGIIAKIGSLALRSVKSAAVAAPVGALYGAGEADPGKLLQGAASGAKLASVLGAAGPIVGDLAGRLNTRKIVPISENVRKAGSALFKQAEAEGGVLPAPMADRFRQTVLSTLDMPSEAKLFGSSPASERIINNISDFAGQPMTFETATAIDQGLGDLAYGTMDKFGKLTKEGNRFLEIQSALRDAMYDIPGSDTIRKARELWSASIRIRDVERIMENAQRFEQPATSLRAGFRTLLRNSDKTKSWTKMELKALESASKTGVVTDFFRLAGSGLAPILSGIAGTAAGGPGTGALASAASFGLQQGAKKIATSRQMGRAAKALESAAMRSGMIEEVQRIPTQRLKQILSLPPAQARAALAVEQARK